MHEQASGMERDFRCAGACFEPGQDGVGGCPVVGVVAQDILEQDPQHPGKPAQLDAGEASQVGKLVRVQRAPVVAKRPNCVNKNATTSSPLRNSRPLNGSPEAPFASP